MTYCSKEECVLGIACVRHISRIPKEHKNEKMEDLSNDEDFCIIKKCQEKPCKGETE